MRTMRFRVFQCPVNVDYCFRGFDEAKDKWSRGDYVHVYSGIIEAETIDGALEKLFMKLNGNLPEDYYGRSLSVSDVVWLDNGTRRGTCYYCDSFGWSECPLEGR